LAHQDRWGQIDELQGRNSNKTRVEVERETLDNHIGETVSEQRTLQSKTDEFLIAP